MRTVSKLQGEPILNYFSIFFCRNQAKICAIPSFSVIQNIWGPENGPFFTIFSMNDVWISKDVHFLFYILNINLP
jgi:hypothetical protein